MLKILLESDIHKLIKKLLQKKILKCETNDEKNVLLRWFNKEN